MGSNRRLWGRLELQIIFTYVCATTVNSLIIYKTSIQQFYKQIEEMRHIEIANIKANK